MCIFVSVGLLYCHVHVCVCASASACMVKFTFMFVNRFEFLSWCMRRCM